MQRPDPVRELKRDILRALARGRLPPAAGGRHGHLWPRHLRSPPDTPPLALGVGRGRGGEPRLAVRVLRTPPGLGAALDRIAALAAAAGVALDVRTVGWVVAQCAAPAGHGARRRWRPLVAGCSLGHRRGRTGTLGAVVVPAAGGRRALLSCAHVLAPAGEGGGAGPGPGVVQPAVGDGGRFPVDRVARLAVAAPPRPGRRNRLDAALAELLPGVGCDARRLPGLGRLAGLRRAPLAGGEIVFKVGRTTGVTRGRVSAVEVDGLVVDYPAGEALFDGQLEIEPAPGTAGRPFSEPCDSGALVVDEALRAVGLLFAGNGLDASFAQPIGTVLDRFGVRLA